MTAAKQRHKPTLYRVLEHTIRLYERRAITDCERAEARRCREIFEQATQTATPGAAPGDMSTAA
jgi:hypothetical protein